MNQRWPDASEGTTLILVRHGQTESNAEKRYMGQLDSPLSERGIRQAAAVAARLADMKLSALYASDLGRAANTAQAIAQACDLPVISDHRLRERHAGVFQGMLMADAKQQYPEIFQAIQKPAPVTSIPGGESAVAVRARLVPLLDELCSDYPGKHIALVTHGIVIRTALWYFLDSSYARARFAQVDNTSLTVFRFAHARWILQQWNDIGHLP